MPRVLLLIWHALNNASLFFLQKTEKWKFPLKNTHIRADLDTITLLTKYIGKKTTQNSDFLREDCVLRKIHPKKCKQNDVNIK